MLKNVVIAVLGLSAHGLACAGAMGPVCTPGNVTVPCVGSAWEFGVQGLYLSSSFATQNTFGTIVEIPFALPGLTSAGPVEFLTVPTNPLLGTIDNQWNWGFLLDGAYHFNTGNDVTVNWLHYTNNSNQSWNDTQPAVLGDVGFAEPLIFVADQSFVALGQNTFDQVNIELGQLANFGLVKQLRFYGGLQYAHIDVDAQTCYAFHISRVTPAFAAPISFNWLGGTFNNTDYKGVGPIAGIDYAYHFSDAFSITANGSGSILYGTNRFSAGLLDPSGQVVLAGVNANTSVMVPSLQAELGVNYSYATGQGLLNVKAGYLAVNYFNALQTQLVSTGLAVGTTDYSLYGPYVGLSYVGSV
ncbi:MAG: Lpg1974 family pore-forming outer membrane protein [Legionella sp.]